METRTLTSTISLNDYLDWPDVGQVFRLERTRRIGESETTETVYGITSLNRSAADAALLLALTRTHWQIENSLHWVRDVTMGEDGRYFVGTSAAGVSCAGRTGENLVRAAFVPIPDGRARTSCP